MKPQIPQVPQLSNPEDTPNDNTSAALGTVGKSLCSIAYTLHACYEAAQFPTINSLLLQDIRKLSRFPEVMGVHKSSSHSHLSQ